MFSIFFILAVIFQLIAATLLSFSLSRLLRICSRLSVTSVDSWIRISLIRTLARYSAAAFYACLLLIGSLVIGLLYLVNLYLS